MPRTNRRPYRRRARPRGSAWKPSGADDLLEGRLVADRVEVRVLRRVPAKLLGTVSRVPEVLDRVVRPAGERLAAGEVVEQQRVLRVGLGQLASAVGGRGVLAGLVERRDLHPELPPVGLVRLPGDAADRYQRRAGLLRERRPLHRRRDEDERALGRVPPLAVELEHGPALGHEIELLAPVVRLVVLVDDPVADFSSGPRVDSERGDAEVVAHGAQGLATVADLVDLVEVDDSVIAQEASDVTRRGRPPRPRTAPDRAVGSFGNR